MGGRHPRGGISDILLLPRGCRPLLDMKLRTILASQLLGIAACKSTPPTAPSSSSPPSEAHLDWPVPVGWKRETIPFPLEFAPGLPYRGTEELRFAPGFSQPGSSTFWSYAFAWLLENPPRFDAASLAPVLREYFSGLALAVGKEKYPMDPERFRVELAPKVEGGRTILAGQVHSYDPFATGEAIDLNVEARLRDCPRAGRPVLTFLLSPRPFGDAVWEGLHVCESDLRCE